MRSAIQLLYLSKVSVWGEAWVLPTRSRRELLGLMGGRGGATATFPAPPQSTFKARPPIPSCFLLLNSPCFQIQSGIPGPLISEALSLCRHRQRLSPPGRREQPSDPPSPCLRAHLAGRGPRGPSLSAARWVPLPTSSS